MNENPAVNDAATQASDKANQAMGQAQNICDQALGDMRTMVATQPVTALSLALLVGVLLGIFLRR